MGNITQKSIVKKMERKIHIYLIHNKKKEKNKITPKECYSFGYQIYGSCDQCITLWMGRCKLQLVLFQVLPFQEHLWHKTFTVSYFSWSTHCPTPLWCPPTQCQLRRVFILSATTKTQKKFQKWGNTSPRIQCLNAQKALYNRGLDLLNEPITYIGWWIKLRFKALT